MNATIVGLLGSGAGFILNAIITLCIKRYEKAQEIKEARDDLEANLRRQALVWREHAYAVRVVALKSGVIMEDLPPLPKEG